MPDSDSNMYTRANPRGPFLERPSKHRIYWPHRNGTGASIRGRKHIISWLRSGRGCIPRKRKGTADADAI